MSGYICYFKTRLINGLQYRSAAFAGILTQIFWGFLNVMLYISFYSHVNQSNFDISLSQIVTYVWLNQAFLILIFVYLKDNSIMNTIKNGTVAYSLCRPYNLYTWWYIKLISDKYSAALLRFIPIIILGLLLPSPYNLGLPDSIISFILFIIALILGSLILVSIHMLIISLGFVTNEDKGFSRFFLIVADLLAGGIVPLPLLPKLVQKVGYFLPFRFISDFSFRIYSGNIPVSVCLNDIIIQIIWLVILLFIGQFVMNKILKKVCIQGG